MSDGERIYQELWANGEGSGIEVVFQAEPIAGEDPSDRIWLRIRQSGGDWRGWLMNVEDAMAIIRGLSAGVARCVDGDVPTKAKP